MKPIRIKILLSVFVILLGINANAENPISVTTDWGSIAACGADYVDYMNRTWIINLGVQKPVEFEINIDLEYGCDYLNVYAIDNNNTEHYIGTYTGCESGLIVNSVIPSGKAKVVLITDGSVCNDNGYWGVESYCYIDNSYNVTTSQNSAVNQNLFVSGNSYFQGKVGIGTYFPEAKLDVNGNIQAGTTYKIKLMDFPGHASWIDIPAVADKASGIGSGGAGQNAWIGYAGKASNWFANSIAGDICYRNTSGKLLFGNTAGNAAMAISGNRIGIGTTTPQAGLHVTQTNNYNGNLISAIFGATYNDWTYFGGTTGGRIRGDNSGYLVLDSNPNGTSDKNLYLNFGSPGNILIARGGGNVGIGTGITTPGAKLDIAGDIQISSKIGIYLNDKITDTNNPYNGLSHYSQAWISDSWTTSGYTLWQSAYGGIKFFTGGTPRLSISNTGKVGIGISNITTDALLTVNGIIHAKEVRVDLTGLADFVFDDSYKLMPLHQVESYVKANNHLPEMPSAAEVSKNGLSMGEMQNKLLQKVEELTLYVIEQQKTINAQSSQISAQNAKIEELKASIKH